MKRAISLVLTVLLLVSLMGCGNNAVTTPAPAAEPAAGQEAEPAADQADDPVVNDTPASIFPEINGGQPITIEIFLQALNPTINQEPTLEDPHVFRSTQILADAFMEIHPNVNIEWTRFTHGDDTFSTMENAAEWLTITIAAGTAPHTVFTWGTTFADRDWFIPFNDILEEPNYYAGEPRWKDMFPSYLWNSNTLVAGDNIILAIPLTLSAGPPTAYFYNREIFGRLNLTPPRTWEETFAVGRVLQDHGYFPLIPWSGNAVPVLSLWDISINLAPQFILGFIDDIEFLDGRSMTALENARACLEGYFSPLLHEYAREMWFQVKRKFTELYGEGIEAIDGNLVWQQGQAGMVEDGLWRLPGELADTNRPFEFGLVPNPIASSDTSPFIPTIEFTDSGPFQPDPVHMFNLTKSRIEADGPGSLEATVAFLKYLTVPEHLSMIVMEQGSTLGAVRGTEVPLQLADWITQSFPKVPFGLVWAGSSTLGGYTTEGQQAMSRELEAWVRDMIDDDTFFRRICEMSRADALAYAEAMGADISYWNIVHID